MRNPTSGVKIPSSFATENIIKCLIQFLGVSNNEPRSQDIPPVHAQIVKTL